MTEVDKLAENFTCDEEIVEWVDGDNSIELCGYVDFIEGIRKVTSNGKPTDLYKVTVNNGSNCRVKVNFWGNLAKQYSVKIQDRTIISLVRARTIVPKMRFNNPNDIIHGVELTVTSSTVITVYKEKYEKVTMNISDVKTVKIQDISSVEGFCYVEGYLKQPFAKVTAFGGSYGAGVLVDDEFKIPLRLLEFDEKTLKYEKGCYLKILGSPLIYPKSVVEFSISNAANITESTTVEQKTGAELRKIGLRTPKRKHDGEVEARPVKGSPFDN